MSDIYMMQDGGAPMAGDDMGDNKAGAGDDTAPKEEGAEATDEAA